MTEDIEELLRRSLQARAQDVQPNADVWARVSRRIDRGRPWRLALGGGLAVATLAVVALVVPTLRSQRVDFEPAPPVASQPEETRSDPPSRSQPPPGRMVFSDGSGLYATNVDGESAIPLLGGDAALCQGDVCAEGDTTLTAVDVRPGLPAEHIDVAYAVSARCGTPLWSSIDLDEEEVTDVRSGDLTREALCSYGGPVVSPDGGFLAWAVAGSHSGDWSLATVDWSGRAPGEDDAGFGLEALGSVFDVRVEDWVWVEETNKTAQGFITLTVRPDSAPGAAVQAYTVGVERQPDGALAVAGEPERLRGDNGFEPVAFADVVDASYTMEINRAEDGTVTDGRIVRRVDSTETVIGLPEELLAAPDLDVGALWLSAAGDTVIYGDGQGQAWFEHFEPGDATSGGRIDAQIVDAELLAPLADGPTPEEPATEPAGPATEVEVHFVTARSACGEDVRAFPRSVEGRGVLRGALEQWLAGPTDEEIAAGATGRWAGGAAALNGVTIGDNGVAEVDFAQLPVTGSESCKVAALFTQLDATVKQFPNVKEAVYALNGSVEAFYDAYELVAPLHRPDIPLAVTRMQGRIIDALGHARRDGDYDALAELIDRETFSCSFSDQNEDCIALWRSQEADGQDPLGPLSDILQGEPAKVDGAAIWAWPREFVETEGYLGPRTGVQRDGTWRYYQQGGD